MPESTWARVSVRLRSVAESEVEIEALIGLKPSSSYGNGQLMNPRDPQSKSRSETLLVYRSGLESSTPIEAQLDAINPVLGRIARIDPARWPVDLRVDVIIGVDRVMRAVVLPRELVGALDAARATVEIWIGANSEDAA